MTRQLIDSSTTRTTCLKSNVWTTKYILRLISLNCYFILYIYIYITYVWNIFGIVIAVYLKIFVANGFIEGRIETLVGKYSVSTSNLGANIP